MDINKINLKSGYKIIEASAGTGKTFTLVHLFLRSYFEDEYEVDNILLLSFTNKTCNELRERIIERFSQLDLLINNKISKDDLDQTIVLWFEKKISVKGNKEKLIYKINKFFNDVNNLKIFTFHGFCKNILENYNFEIKTQQGFIVNNEIDYLYSDIINELWISEFYNLDFNIIKAIDEKKIKSKWSKVSKINKKFFLNLLKEIDNENIFQYSLQNSYLSDQNISSALKKYINKNWTQFIDNWDKKGYELFLKLKEIGNEIKVKGFESNIYKSKPRNKFENINSWIHYVNNQMLLEKNDNKYIYEITKLDLLTKYFYKQSIFSELEKFNIKFDINEFLELQDCIYRIKDGFFNEFIRIFIHKLYLKLIKVKEEKGIINYSDIIKIIEKKCLLESNNNYIFKEISNKYKTIFIDEFQDTDSVQWKIIRNFFSKSDHLLICVGDPKQAIYKFRGGDIKAYLKARNQANEIYNLDVNYRSSNQILEIINKIYSKGLESSKLNYTKLLSPDKNRLKNYQNPFQIIEFKEEKNIPKFTIDFIIKLLLSDNEINLENIVILTNDNFQCLVFKNLLNKFNIPCNIVNKKNIFDTEASHLMEIFLSCLYKPNSKNYILSLCKSKLIQIEINSILDYQNSKEIDNLFKKFKIWSNEIQQRGFISILREFIIIYKSQALIQDLDLYCNLIQLSEIIEIKFLHLKFNIFKLLSWYKYELNETTRNCKGEEYLVNSSKNLSPGINISTVHSSKGLEYDTVICPYLWDQKKSIKKLKGPIWRDSENMELYVNIDSSCEKVKRIKNFELYEQINELERLMYVALTRAKNELVIFNNIENKDNLLYKYLLSNIKNYNEYKLKIDFELKESDIDKIKNKFEKKINNEFEKLLNSLNKKKNYFINEDLNIRSSYSSWIRGKKFFNLYNLNKDYDDDFSIHNKNFLENNSSEGFENPKLLIPNPLSEFPKGANAGICLHRIIERFNFQEIDNLDYLNPLIREELSSFGFDKSYTNIIREALKRIIFSSLGVNFNNKRLIDVNKSNMIKEFKFDLPISFEGKFITSKDLAKCFLLDKDAEFGKDYSIKVNELNIYSKGFHSGCIDCLVKIKGRDNQSKWWIIDWKSNFISNDKDIDSLPKNYNYYNLREEMIKHHYPLQSHLYLLAVHRLLKWRLKNYNPKNDLGGYLYIFIRGLPDEEIEQNLKNVRFQPGIFYSETPINRIIYLDKLFSNEI